MEESTTPKMIYRYLGNSGLRVSVLSYGNWLTAHDPKSEEVGSLIPLTANLGNCRLYQEGL